MDKREHPDELGAAVNDAVKPLLDAGPPIFRCDECGRTFSTHKAIAIHDRAHGWRAHMKTKGLWPL